jgi:Uma2 family endonuclease
MATVLSPTEQKVIIENVSWQTYEQLLADLADRSAPRLTYDRGTLQIMSPTSRHEELNRNLPLTVTILAAALGLDVRNLGSTTFRRGNGSKHCKSGPTDRRRPDYFETREGTRGRRRRKKS